MELFDIFIRYVTQSEDVQYMRFDSCGNLYLYEPGAGMSGIPRKVIELGSDEVIYDDTKPFVEGGKKNNGFGKFKGLASDQIHRVVPSRGVAVTNISDGKTRY